MVLVSYMLHEGLEEVCGIVNQISTKHGYGLKVTMMEEFTDRCMLPWCMLRA